MSGERHAPVPFPPRPRSWNQLIDRIIATAGACADPVAWQPVRIDGLDHPWIGVRAPSLDTARAWQWDVVTPDDHEHEPLLHADPLTLSVPQDTMVVDIGRVDQTDVHVRLTVPLARVPITIDVAANALPPPPWFVELATGWSTPAIAAAMSDWLLRMVGHPVAVTPPPAATPGTTGDDDRFALGDGLFATSEGFDALLELDPRDAARVSTAFHAVCDALEPYR
jgi:hypothetical protein